MNSPTPSYVRSARTVSLAVLGSRVLGLVREQVLAGLFGASREFDAFITAFRIPNLLRDLFAEGALSAAFITTFSQKFEQEGKKAAWRLANLVLNALLVVLSLVTIAGIVCAPWIVRLIAPGFAEIPGKLELTTLLTRIMFPFLLLIAVAALVMGMLNSQRRFGIPASASMMFNLGSILGGVGLGYWLDPSFGARAMVGMALGTLIGGAAQLLIQVPSLFAVGFRYRPLLNWQDPGLRRVIALLGPSVIGVAAVQINVFVNNWFASWPQMSGAAGSGAVTWLNCSFRLMQFPIGLFGVAISVATLPAVSALAARGDTAAFRKQVARSIRLALFLCLPAAAGLAVLAEPIIAAIYQHGRFDAAATAQTAWCLRAYAIGLAGYAALKVLAPTFYALGDSRTPALVSLGSIVVNIGLCWLFAMKLGLAAPGLALSTSVVALVNFLLLLGFMRRKIERIEARSLLWTLVKVGVATALMSATAYSAHQFLVINQYLNLLVAVVAAVIVYGAAGKLLRIEELGELIGVFRFQRGLEEGGQP